MLALAIGTGAAGPLAAQGEFRPDTIEAADRARVAASGIPVGGYILAGLVGGPATVVSAGVVLSGELDPRAAIGPALLVFAESRSRRNNSISSVEMDHLIQRHDSLYASVYARTYTETLQRRKAAALRSSALIGTMASAVLVLMTFSGGT